MFSIKKILKSKEAAMDDPVPGHLSQALLTAQRKAADYLNLKTVGLSQRKAMITLVLFCLVMGTASLFIAGKAFFSANGPPKSIKVERLKNIDPLFEKRSVTTEN